jgi:hypothetical protein
MSNGLYSKHYKARKFDGGHNNNCQPIVKKKDYLYLDKTLVSLLEWWIVEKTMVSYPIPITEINVTYFG